MTLPLKKEFISKSGEKVFPAANRPPSIGFDKHWPRRHSWHLLPENF